MSEQFNNLESGAKRRYVEKIRLVANKDPYLLSHDHFTNDINQFPKVEWGDIVNYLVYGRSAYTNKEFKAYKSLKAYNQFVCKWVKNVKVTQISGMVLVLAEVLHSQRLSEKHLLPWVIISPNGTVENAHCTCVAGLGEACTHVAAVLFFIEDAVRRLEEESVTSILPYWTSPSNQTVKFSEVENIDFSNPLRNRKTDVTKQQLPLCIPPNDVTELSDGQFFETLKQLKHINSNAAILNVVRPFCERKEVPHPMEFTKLFEEKYLLCNLIELQKIALDIVLRVTAEEARNLERNTIKQSKSSLWFKHRAGRITASKFKAVCRTKVENPSLCLIKYICYPQMVKLTTKAIVWGCTHEKEAKASYVKMNKNQHLNFRITDAGLFLNPNYPQFGATPDGLIDCDCCEGGILEIKCPYCVRNSSKEEMIEKADCLVTQGDITQLKTEHAYYYQVQAQLFITEKLYCDFVVYSTKTIFVQRIPPDTDFWKENMPIANTLFRMVILPELMGKYFTRQSNNNIDSCKSKKRPLIIDICSKR